MSTLDLESWKAKFQKIKKKNQLQKQAANVNQPVNNNQNPSSEVNLIPALPLKLMQMNSAPEKQNVGETKQQDVKKPYSSQRYNKQSRQKQITQSKQVLEKQQSPKQLEVQKLDVRCLSQNIVISKPNSIADDAGQGQKQKTIKMTRFLLKDIDKIKQTIVNLETTLKGLQYIQKRMKSDRLFYKKIKAKINQLRGANQQQQRNRSA